MECPNCKNKITQNMVEVAMHPDEECIEVLVICDHCEKEYFDHVYSDDLILEVK